jgi:hypothetical protein
VTLGKQVAQLVNRADTIDTNSSADAIHVRSPATDSLCFLINIEREYPRFR